MPLSTNSTYILNQLQTENTALNETNLQLPTQIAAYDDLADIYQVPSTNLEKVQQIFTIVNSINTKKQQIVNLCAVGLGTFAVGIATPTCAMESNVNNLTSPIISETGTIAAGSVPRVTPQIAYGVVRRDSIRVQFYQSLESEQALTDNPYGAVTYPTVLDANSPNAGKGSKTIFFSNATYNDGFINIRVWNDAGDWAETWNGSNNVIGNYYKIVGLGTTCVGLASSITQLENEIVTLRSQIQQYLNPINTVKGKKHNYQLQSWALRRTLQVNNDTISSNTQLINLINDPANIQIFGTP